MQFLKPPILIILAIVIAGGGVYFVLRSRGVSPVGSGKAPPVPGTPPPSGSSATPPSSALDKRTYNPNITESADDVFQNQDDLYSYVKKFGPKKTVQHLAELVPKYGSCHDPAHRAGRYAYELFGDKAFQQCSAECHSGCYHGATEAYFRDHGTANLAENLKVICSSASNPFFSHQCIHGIGHGLMAWADYGLFDALSSCDLLTQRQDSCWTGVFMENIVGALGKEDGHFTKYLSNDPLYPCDDPKLDDKYKSACYFLQTSRMLQLVGTNWDKVSADCASAPSAYQRSCFESMGRDVGGSYPDSAEKEIAACASAPAGNLRIGCLIGAAQNAFWDPSGQNLAIHFCKLLTDAKEKSACYDIIFARAPDVLTSASDMKSFCAKAETDYQNRCLAYIR